MNLFDKALLLKTLDNKVNSSEIKNYILTGSKLHIKKSKRSKYTIDLDEVKPIVIIKVLSKKIPDVSVINIENYFKREIRNVKLNNLFNS